MKKLFTLIIFTFLFTQLILSQTVIPALITTDQTWDASGNPYQITQNTYINPGIKVTVMPGVIIKATSANPTLMVGGELQMLGKKDTMITLDSFEISFENGSIGYNIISGKGAYFNYCTINGSGVAKTSIRVNKTNIKITNCNFSNSYYAIYCQTGSVNGFLIVDNCVFKNCNNPVYATGGYKSIFITNSEMYNAQNMYLYGKVFFEKNIVDGFSKIRLGIYRSSIVNCNTFKNSQYGVEVEFRRDLNENGLIKFTNNTLDSMGKYINLPMLSVRNLSSHDSTHASIFENNNFLNTMGITEKVVIYGNNSNVNNSDTFSFKSNYWGSTTVSDIESYIHDYKDDITLYATVDFSSYLSSKNTVCTSNNFPCNADFTYEVDGDSVTFTDKSTAGNSYDITWLYGNGQTGSGSVSGHKYATKGNYTACVVIYNISTLCYDTFCQTIVVDGDTSSCEAAFYLGVDTTNAYKLYVINTSKGVTSNTNYIWAFGDGKGSTLKTPSHTYSSNGKYQLCLTLVDTAANCYSTYCDTITVDSTGISGFSLEFIDESDLTGTEEIKSFEDLTVYPNPSTGEVFVKVNSISSENVELIVTNSMGQTVLIQNHFIPAGESAIQINMSEFSNGLYFIRLENKNTSGNSKVLLNK